MISQAAGFARAGVPEAYDWLATAKTAREDWVTKYSDIRKNHPETPITSLPQILRDPAEAAFAASQQTETPTGDNEWQAAIKQLAEDMRTQTLRGQAIEKMEPDKLVIAWMQELATGRLGTSAALAAQSPSSPGVVAGGFR